MHWLARAHCQRSREAHGTQHIESTMDHMHKMKQGSKSTCTPGQAATKQDAAHDIRIHTINTDQIKDNVSPDRCKELLATDLPGRYPVTSARGHKYLFVIHNYDANYIHATPI